MSKLNPNNIKVGQKLLWIYRDMGDTIHRTVLVATVGHKWATIQGFSPRLNLSTMDMHTASGFHDGKCYLSEQHWQTEITLAKALDKFIEDLVKFKFPAPPKLEQLDQVREILGLPPAK